MERATEYTTLPEMILASAKRFSNHPALIDIIGESEYSTITYQDLLENIIKVSTQLISLNIQPKDRVGLIAEGRSWWPICDIAIMSSGAWTVPIYSSLPSNQVQYIIRHSEMRGIFVENTKQLAKLFEPDDLGLPNLEFIVVLDANAADLREINSTWPLFTYREWLAGVSDENAVLERIESISKSDVASIVYTSGTTGLPKGVLLTHENFLSNMMSIRHVLDVFPSDRSLSYLPLSHIFERTVGQFFMLSMGSTICFSRGFAHIQDDLKILPPTIMTSVPRLLEKVYERIEVEIQKSSAVKKSLFRAAVAEGTRVRVDKLKRAGLKLSLFDKAVFSKIKDVFGNQLRLIVSGGAPLPPQVGSFFTAVGILVLEGYGMTETSPVVAVNRPGAVKFGTVGFPIDCVQISFAEDGELLVKGPSITQGYFKNDEATQELLTEDGWLHTGDIAELSEKGFLRITDRKKNLLVLSTGKKVAPAPIESEILGSPYIDQILIVGQGRKYISAIVVPAQEPVLNWLREKGKKISPDDWVNDQSVYDLLLKEVVQRTSDYAAFEKPKKLLIANDPFTVENGLLTPTLKVRAKAVLAAYGEQIDSLYSMGEDGVRALAH